MKCPCTQDATCRKAGCREECSEFKLYEILRFARYKAKTKEVSTKSEQYQENRHKRAVRKLNG